jgi:hypothetical protein
MTAKHDNADYALVCGLGNFPDHVDRWSIAKIIWSDADTIVIEDKAYGKVVANRSRIIAIGPRQSVVHMHREAVTLFNSFDAKMNQAIAAQGAVTKARRTALEKLVGRKL